MAAPGPPAPIAQRPELLLASRRRVSAAADGKVSPESVFYGLANGVSRCGNCVHYQPTPENSYRGRCDHVDIYRVERNMHCRDWEANDPGPAAGQPSVDPLLARSAAQVYALFSGGPDPELLTRLEVLAGQVRVHRNQVAMRYSGHAPRLMARWAGGDY
jgi:hypothetical protein